MNDLRQYGVAVMTLSEMVDDFCLAQGNIQERAILAQYRHARWSWKDLFRTTLWNIRKAVLCVDCDTGTIRLPNDCDRLLAISVIDCFGKLHPLGFNSDWNTAQIACVKSSCSCNKCKGEDTLCGAIDSIRVETETVNIRGVDYTQTTWTRYDGTGAVQKQMKIPAWEEASASVVYNVIVETICNVETTSSGCIAATNDNMVKLRDYCGCGTFLDQWNSLGIGWEFNSKYRELAPTSYNYWGEFNFNAADPNIVHIFGGPGTLHYGHTQDQENTWRHNIRKVVLDYQTNGETPNTEILIPEYAVNAVQVGMVYQQKFLNPKVSEGDKLASEFAFNRAKLKVAKYLNPIHLEQIRAMQNLPRLW